MQNFKIIFPIISCCVQEICLVKISDHPILKFINFLLSKITQSTVIENYSSNRKPLQT